MEALIEKLNRITEAWKAQFHPPYQEGWTPEHFKTVPDLPLAWSVRGGLLYLDHVWICPVKFIRQEKLEEAAAWVNPVTIQLLLTDSHLDIFIYKELGEPNYRIAGIERAISYPQRKKHEAT